GLRLDSTQIAAVAAIATNPDHLIDNSVNTDQLVGGAVTTSKLADKSVTADKVAPGAVVMSINSLKDDVNLSAGNNIAITSTGNTLRIDSLTTNGTDGRQGPTGPAGPAGAAGPI